MNVDKKETNSKEISHPKGSSTTIQKYTPGIAHTLKRVVFKVQGMPLEVPAPEIKSMSNKSKPKPRLLALQEV